MSEFKLFVDLHKFNFVNMHPAMNLNQWVVRADDVEILVRKLDAERKRADEAEKDAKRYRRMRTSYSWVESGLKKAGFFGPGCIKNLPETLDAAIDEEMKNG